MFPDLNEPNQSVPYEVRDIQSRIKGLEDKTSDVAVSLAKVATAMEAMQDHEHRIRELELNSKNNAIVINAVKWITVTVIGSAITITVITLFEFVFQLKGG